MISVGEAIDFSVSFVEFNGLETQEWCIQGVFSVDEHCAEWIVARERVGRIVPNFHIAMEMSLSSSHVGLHG